MKVILVGKAAAGKDYFRSRLLNKGFKCGVSHTTRDPRKTEIEGEDYHYSIVFTKFMNLKLLRILWLM